MTIGTADVARALHDAQVLKHGLFTLRSGAKSPVYVDLRHLPSVPAAMDVVTDALADRVRRLDVDAIAGAETAGIPLAAIVGLKTTLPMLYVRSQPKAHGTGSQVEGIVRHGDRIVLMDDLITHGTSKFVFLDALEEAGTLPERVLVILDRQEGGTEALVERGKTLEALLTLRDLLDEFRKMNALDGPQYEDILAYLDDPEAWRAALPD